MRLLTIKRGSNRNTDVSAHNTISFSVLILDEYDSPFYSLGGFVSSLKRIVCSFFVLILIRVKRAVSLICR